MALLLLLQFSGLSSVSDWPNLLDNTSWMFDLGSQAGYRPGNSSKAGAAIEGPGPDWAVRTNQGPIPMVGYELAGSDPSSAAVSTMWPGAVEVRQRWAKELTTAAHLAFDGEHHRREV
jgi:hypothetical protein